MMDYVTFLLDLAAEGAEGNNRAIRETVAYRRQAAVRPRTAFEWKVTCDATSKVIVVGLVRKSFGVLATASWHAGTLAEHKQREPHTPNAFQWNLVEVSLRAELLRRAAMHDRSGEQPVADGDLVEDLEQVERLLSDRPPPEQESRYEQAMAAVAKNRASRRRWIISALAVAAALLALIVVLASAQRAADTRAAAGYPDPGPVPASPATPVLVAPPPVPEPIEVQITRAATFAEAVAIAKPAMTDTTSGLGGGATLFATYAAAKLRWEDVEVPAETTVGHVLKDSEVERGKRMCVDGTIETIERRDLERRKIYIGSLRLADGDRVAFVAVGTTGELVKRKPARFCGAAIGKVGSAVSMVGMFDLPENRSPIVEQ